MQLYEQPKPDLDAFAKAEKLSVKQAGPFSDGQDSGLAMSAEAIKWHSPLRRVNLERSRKRRWDSSSTRSPKRECTHTELKEVADRVAADLRTKMAVEKAKEYAKKLAASSPDQLNAQTPKPQVNSPVQPIRCRNCP
jgi:hypothetical protein